MQICCLGTSVGKEDRDSTVKKECRLVLTFARDGRSAKAVSEAGVSLYVDEAPYAPFATRWLERLPFRRGRSAKGRELPVPKDKQNVGQVPRKREGTPQR